MQSKCAYCGSQESGIHKSGYTCPAEVGFCSRKCADKADDDVRSACERANLGTKRFRLRLDIIRSRSGDSAALRVLERKIFGLFREIQGMEPYTKHAPWGYVFTGTMPDDAFGYLTYPDEEAAIAKGMDILDNLVTVYTQRTWRPPHEGMLDRLGYRWARFRQWFYLRWDSK